MSSGARSLNPAEMLHCIGEPPSWLPAATLKGSSRSCRAFRDPTFFTRWLFRQQRGAGVPQTPLLVGWREAKPCVQAIVAARTGNTGGLRDDHGRPELRAARPGIVNVAVKDMIVVVEQTRTRKAHEWAQGGAYGIDIHVVSSIVELHQVWQTIHGAQLAPKQTPCSTPTSSTPASRTPTSSAPPSPTHMPPSPTLLGTLGLSMRPPPGLEHPDGHLEILASKQPWAPHSPYRGASAPNDTGYECSPFGGLPLQWTDLESNKEMTLGAPARAAFPQRAGLATENRAMRDLEWNKKTMLGEPARATFSQWAGLATETRAMLAFSKGSAGDMSVAYVLQV